MPGPTLTGLLQQANIAELGTVKSTDGTSEWDRDWQDLINTDGVNSPKILERPEISSTDEARKSRTYGKVKISFLINNLLPTYRGKTLNLFERNFTTGWFWGSIFSSLFLFRNISIPAYMR